MLCSPSEGAGARCRRRTPRRWKPRSSTASIRGSGSLTYSPNSPATIRLPSSMNCSFGPMLTERSPPWPEKSTTQFRPPHALQYKQTDSPTISAPEYLASEDVGHQVSTIHFRSHKSHNTMWLCITALHLVALSGVYFVVTFYQSKYAGLWSDLMTVVTYSGQAKQREVVACRTESRFARMLNRLMNWSMKRANDELFRLKGPELTYLDLQRTDIPFLLKLGRPAS